MNVTTSHIDGVVLLHVKETRLTYPILADFATAATNLIGAGEKKILVDLTPVSYVDSATIGCLMDLFRQAQAAGGSLKLTGRAEARRDDVADDGRAQLPRGARRPGVRARELRRLTMRTITTTAGTPRGPRRRRARDHRDHLARPARQKGLDYGFEDVDHEIQNIVVADDAGRAAGLPQGKPLHELQPVRERSVGGAREKGQPRH